MLKAAANYARFAWGLRALHRYPGHQDREAILRDQLQHREERFLDLLRRIVFANPQHPQRQLLREARCEVQDVEHLVATNGLESALGDLRRAGVWLSHDEFKGNTPIARGGVHMTTTPADFVNPLAEIGWNSQTSGSTGKPASVPVVLANMAHRECYFSLAFDQFGVSDRRYLTLQAILPSPFGFTRPVWNQKSGTRIQHWYAVPGARRESPYYRLASRLLLAELRLLGIDTPPLTFLPQNDFLPAARDIAEARARGVLSFVAASSSSSVRVAGAALEHNLDISGTRFFTAGEGLSPAKAAAIRRAGAESVAGYWANEFGTIGLGCPHYEGQNTVHHFRDALAIVQQRRQAPGIATEVNSLLFTTLLPSAPLFVINLELGDHAVIEPARCGCRFAELGFDTVISEIFSYTKLTTYGTVLPGVDIVHILEQVLPARFGGSAADYQLLEQEGEGGTETSLVLRVNPRLGEVSLTEVQRCFFDEVKKLFGGSLVASVWQHASAVKVVAAAPLAGRTGKILPIHVLARGRNRRELEGTVRSGNAS